MHFTWSSASQKMMVELIGAANDICTLHKISVYLEHIKDLQGRPSIVIALKCLGTCKLVSTLSGTISLVPSLLLEANFKQRAVTIDENVSRLLATP